ncbi:unnamed protein product [Symbiodinium sp. KB8]|nr:unnamed protein product [Symbiodinium sp. KB8]
MLPAWSDCSWGFRTTPPALMPEEDPGTPRISRRRSWGVLDVDEAGFGDFRQATGEQTMNIWQAAESSEQQQSMNFSKTVRTEEITREANKQK